MNVDLFEAFYAVPDREYRPRREGYVYFVQKGEHGPVKIGWSMNPRKRLSAIRSNSSEEIRSLKVEWTSRKRERELHARFAEFRLNGEWFEPTPEILLEAGIQPTE